MRYYGNVGFVSTAESVSEPGIWNETVTEKTYYGDIINNTRRLDTSGNQVIDSVEVNNQISIVADPFATNNFHAIRYAYYMGTAWRVTNVDVQYPRLILSLGGVYDGNTVGTTPALSGGTGE